MSLQQRRIGSIETLEQRQLMAGDTLDAVTPDVEPSAMIFVQIPGMGDKAIKTEGHQDQPTRFTADSFCFAIEREMKESGEKGGTEDFNIGVGELQECTISKSMDWSSPLLAQYAINGNSPGPAEIDFGEVVGSGKDAATDLAFEELGEVPDHQMKFVLERTWVKSWHIEGSDAENAAFSNKLLTYGYAYADPEDKSTMMASKGFKKLDTDGIVGKVTWSATGYADDRPTEEAAFYYNKIAFIYAQTNDGEVFKL